ncbi:D-2-hydroxyacid dehydrogenase [Romboutsia sedimentorum]|uniref:D-2-hydroxyacid dehydrogenase n=1 Tax=Romboutsia sedimentorum TaxID=1368474 RepID=UPI0024DE7B14|nr:D-2-hydroxyacid dehydrogenase [Romboutsia sedimentorum]MDK2586726.1 D-2-hydroxyacid dehydrogenase [Romboutsia sedimentorum]
MYNILITDGLDKDAISKLKELNFNAIEQFYKPNELGDNLNDIDVIIVRSATKITKEIIDKACEYNKLKLIIRAGVGLDNIDVNYANSKGIKVTNTPNASSKSVAELAIGHIFSLARFINISNVEMREGKWEKKVYKGTEINGKILGLIGFGRIAKEVAKKAHALGMKVIYNDTLCECDSYNEYRFCSFDEIVQKSDFISLHIPYNKQIGAIITKKEINDMKDGTYIINCARGPLVCENDLIEALNSGKISGAGLDVFEVEPTKNLELLNHPRVSVTPHIGASTIEAQERIGDEVINIIRDHFNIN